MTAIRVLDSADVDGYQALRQRGLVEHPEAFTSSADEEALLGRARLAARLAPSPDRPHDVVLGAFEDDELIGVCGMRVDPRVKVRHRGHVFGMYVPRERCRRGVGGALLERVVERARAAGSLDALVLSVTATNAGACRLYERHGFVPYGREPGAVRIAATPFDKLLMIRWLDERRRPNADPPATETA